MPLELNKKDISSSGGIENKSSGGEFELTNVISGINKFIGTLGSTINQARGLVEGYNNLAVKLNPNAQMNKLGSPIRQPPKPIEAEYRAQRGTPVQHTEEPKPEEPKEVINMDDKQAKAEEIFKEIHEKVKPFIPMAGAVSGAQIIQWVLQPNNKKMIIDEIAKRL